MAILRSDVQVALNDLHLAMQESADQYRSAAEILQDLPARKVSEQIAAMRQSLATDVAEAIRETGELPSVPDRDRETAEQVRLRMEALFAESETAGIIAHRCDAERALRSALNDDTYAILKGEHQALLERCRKSIESVLGELAALPGGATHIR